MEEGYTRDPCPWRITDDVGAAFSLGAIGSTIYYFPMGMKNAPKGWSTRLNAAAANVKLNSPRTAGGFAMWGGMFSVCDCTLTAVRKKEDAFNSILSGAATGAALAIRRGRAQMIGSAIAGGFILAVIEGVGKLLNYYQTDYFKPVSPVDYPKVMEQMKEQEARDKQQQESSWFPSLLPFEKQQM